MVFLQLLKICWNLWSRVTRFFFMQFWCIWLVKAFALEWWKSTANLLKPLFTGICVFLESSRKAVEFLPQYKHTTSLTARPPPIPLPPQLPSSPCYLNTVSGSRCLLQSAHKAVFFFFFYVQNWLYPFLVKNLWMIQDPKAIKCNTDNFYSKTLLSLEKCY